MKSGCVSNRKGGRPGACARWGVSPSEWAPLGGQSGFHSGKMGQGYWE